MNSNFGPENKAPAKPAGRGGLDVGCESGQTRCRKGPRAENSAKGRWRSCDEIIVGLAQLHAAFENIQARLTQGLFPDFDQRKRLNDLSQPSVTSGERAGDTRKRKAVVDMIARLKPLVLEAQLSIQKYEMLDAYHVSSRTLDTENAESKTVSFADAARDCLRPVYSDSEEEHGVSEASASVFLPVLIELFSNCGTGKRRPGVREFVFYVLAAGMVAQAEPFKGLNPRKVSDAMNRFAWDEAQIRDAINRFCERHNTRYLFSRKPMRRVQNSGPILDPEGDRRVA
jgi:hypothetical protein